VLATLGGSDAFLAPSIARASGGVPRRAALALA
jgi:hypothetical protein